MAQLLGAAPLAVTVGAVLGLPHSVPMLVPVCYAVMFMAQTRGPALIEALHNSTAAVAAQAPPEDVDPSLGVDALCAGYESHHYESTSNCLHAAGMALVFLLFGMFAVQPKASTVLMLPPTW